MASTPLGDIIGARFLAPPVSFTAVASGGANAVLGYFGPFPFNIRPRDLFFVATSGSSAATQSATYRQIALYNGGTAATATATANIMASLNVSATQAQYVPFAATVNTAVTVPSGVVMYYSQATVGGTDANGTVLVGGNLQLDYEII